MKRWVSRGLTTVFFPSSFFLSTSLGEHACWCTCELVEKKVANACFLHFFFTGAPLPEMRIDVKRLRDKIEEAMARGLPPLRATGLEIIPTPGTDNKCFFSSISISLFGSACWGSVLKARCAWWIRSIQPSEEIFGAWTESLGNRDKEAAAAMGHLARLMSGMVESQDIRIVLAWAFCDLWVDVTLVSNEVDFSAQRSSLPSGRDTIVDLGARHLLHEFWDVAQMGDDWMDCEIPTFPQILIAHEGAHFSALRWDSLRRENLSWKIEGMNRRDTTKKRRRDITPIFLTLICDDLKKAMIWDFNLKRTQTSTRNWSAANGFFPLSSRLSHAGLDEGTREQRRVPEERGGPGPGTDGTRTKEGLNPPNPVFGQRQHQPGIHPQKGRLDGMITQTKNTQSGVRRNFWDEEMMRMNLNQQRRTTSLPPNLEWRKSDQSKLTQPPIAVQSQRRENERNDGRGVDRPKMTREDKDSRSLPKPLMNPVVIVDQDEGVKGDAGKPSNKEGKKDDGSGGINRRGEVQEKLDEQREQTSALTGKIQENPPMMNGLGLTDGRQCLLQEDQKIRLSYCGVSKLRRSPRLARTEGEHRDEGTKKTGGGKDHSDKQVEGNAVPPDPRRDLRGREQTEERSERMEGMGTTLADLGRFHSRGDGLPRSRKWKGNDDEEEMCMKEDSEEADNQQLKPKYINGVRSGRGPMMGSVRDQLREGRMDGRKGDGGWQRCQREETPFAKLRGCPAFTEAVVIKDPGWGDTTFADIDGLTFKIKNGTPRNKIPFQYAISKTGVAYKMDFPCAWGYGELALGIPWRGEIFIVSVPFSNMGLHEVRNEMNKSIFLNDWAFQCKHALILNECGKGRPLRDTILEWTRFLRNQLGIHTICHVGGHEGGLFGRIAAQNGIDIRTKAIKSFEGMKPDWEFCEAVNGQCQLHGQRTRFMIEKDLSPFMHCPKVELMTIYCSKRRKEKEDVARDKGASLAVPRAISDAKGYWPQRFEWLEHDWKYVEVPKELLGKEEWDISWNRRRWGGGGRGRRQTRKKTEWERGWSGSLIGGGNHAIGGKRADEDDRGKRNGWCGSLMGVEPGGKGVEKVKEKARGDCRIDNVCERNEERQDQEKVNDNVDAGIVDLRKRRMEGVWAPPPCIGERAIPRIENEPPKVASLRRCQSADGAIRDEVVFAPLLPRSLLQEAVTSQGNVHEKEGNCLPKRKGGERKASPKSGTSGGGKDGSRSDEQKETTSQRFERLRTSRIGILNPREHPLACRLFEGDQSLNNKKAGKGNTRGRNEEEAVADLQGIVDASIEGLAKGDGSRVESSETREEIADILGEKQTAEGHTMVTESEITSTGKKVSNEEKERSEGGEESAEKERARNSQSQCAQQPREGLDRGDDKEDGLDGPQTVGRSPRGERMLQKKRLEDRQTE